MARLSGISLSDIMQDPAHRRQSCAPHPAGPPRTSCRRRQAFGQPAQGRAKPLAIPALEPTEHPAILAIKARRVGVNLLFGRQVSCREIGHDELDRLAALAYESDACVGLSGTLMEPIAEAPRDVSNAGRNTSMFRLST